jgi:hypothetical protein
MSQFDLTFLKVYLSLSGNVDKISHFYENLHFFVWFGKQAVLPTGAYLTCPYLNMIQYYVTGRSNVPALSFCSTVKNSSCAVYSCVKMFSSSIHHFVQDKIFLQCVLRSMCCGGGGVNDGYRCGEGGRSGGLRFIKFWIYKSFLTKYSSLHRPILRTKLRCTVVKSK